jgi:hypothetical protein
MGGDVTNEIKVGDRVRSYDFPGSRDDCYIEGVVEEVGIMLEGCPRYKIRGERIVWRGKDEGAPADPYVYPPVNGTPTLFGDVTNGVKRLA